MFQRRIVLIKWKMGIWKQKLDVHSTEISLVRNCSSLPLPSQQTGIYEQLDAASVKGRKALIDCPVCLFLLQSLLSVFTEGTSKHTGIGQEWPAKEHRKRCSFLKGELFGVMRTTRTCDIRVSGSRAVPSLVERRMLSAIRKAGGVKQAAVCSVAPPSFSSPVIDRQEGWNPPGPGSVSSTLPFSGHCNLFVTLYVVIGKEINTLLNVLERSMKTFYRMSIGE